MVWYGLAILLAFLSLFGFFFLARWLDKKRRCLSPYTKTPLRLGGTISEEVQEKVYRYLFFLQQYDNRMFNIHRAAFCRETGRLFPNCVSWLDTIHVDWTFLRKRYPGNWISWGSLSRDQQNAIENAHHNLDGYQTAYSSPHPSPRAITEEYAQAKPGPLYVDLDTKVVLGWKLVPDTELEVMIVQKPRGKFDIRRGSQDKQQKDT